MAVEISLTPSAGIETRVKRGKAIAPHALKFLLLPIRVGIACFEILQGAVERIINGGGKPITISPPELALLVIVLGVNIFVAYYERTVGKRVKSPILIADAKHTMSDIWVTISVLAGLIGVWLGFQWLDLALAFPVALLVFWSGWTVLKENLPWLVDRMALSVALPQAIAPEVIHAQTRSGLSPDIALCVPGVVNCHDIASRGVLGRQVFIEMHLIVDAADVETAHRMTEEVEKRLEERFNPVRILIHVEPPAYQSNHVSFQS